MTVRISSEAHATAKNKADKTGLKLHRLIEAAIKAFDPVVTLEPNRPHTGKRKAG